VTTYERAACFLAIWQPVGRICENPHPVKNSNSLVAPVSDAQNIEALLGTKTICTYYRTIRRSSITAGHVGRPRPLLYGGVFLNPFLVSVELVPIDGLEAGSMPVVKAYVGLATQDPSARRFTTVRPARSAGTPWACGGNVCSAG